MTPVHGAAPLVERLSAAIRDVPDFPRPGILFKDITPLLADGELFRAACDALAAPYDGEEITQTIATVALDGDGIDRVVSWAGALLQEPHRPLAVQRGIEPSGVYVSYFNYGSPASRYGLYAGRRIVAIDGLPTPDLDTFVDVIRRLDGREAVRINVVDWNDVPDVITLKPDPHYWATYELHRVGHEWRRSELAATL